MAFLGLELNAGLAAAVSLSLLGALWNYSELPELDWSEIAAGAALFVAGAGVELLAGSNALAGLAGSVSGLGVVTQVLYVLAGLLVAVGGLVNGVNQVQDKYA